MEVLISNRQKIPLNRNLIKELSLRILKEMKASEESELSISLVSPQEMKELNRKWRRIDKVTDVLSFAYDKELPLLGDVVLCPEEAGTIACLEREDFNKRIARLLAHGILHLFGYNHKSRKEAEEMDYKEMQLLKNFGPSKLLFE